MISLKSKITQQVLGYFFLRDSDALYVNEMARVFSADSGNLARKLTELEKEGILKSEMRGNQHYYTLNPSYPLVDEYKKIILKTTGFEHILKKALDEVAGIKKAILFGSYAANDMDASSDIDLLVVGNHDTVDLQRHIARIQKTTNREINLVSMSPAEYKKKHGTDPLLRSIDKKKKIILL